MAWSAGLLRGLVMEHGADYILTVKKNKPHHKTTTDFFNAMNANHHRNAFRSVSAAHPSFSSRS